MEIRNYESSIPLENLNSLFCLSPIHLPEGTSVCLLFCFESFLTFVACVHMVFTLVTWSFHLFFACRPTLVACDHMAFTLVPFYFTLISHTVRLNCHPSNLSGPCLASSGHRLPVCLPVGSSFPYWPVLVLLTGWFLVFLSAGFRFCSLAGFRFFLLAGFRFAYRPAPGFAYRPVPVCLPF